MPSSFQLTKDFQTILANNTRALGGEGYEEGALACSGCRHKTSQTVEDFSNTHLFSGGWKFMNEVLASLMRALFSACRQLPSR